MLRALLCLALLPIESSPPKKSKGRFSLRLGTVHTGWGYYYGPPWLLTELNEGNAVADRWPLVCCDLLTDIPV